MAKGKGQTLEYMVKDNTKFIQKWWDWNGQR